MHVASFKEVKQAVSIEQILTRYDLLETLTPKKDGFRGSCPFHQSHGSRSFHVSPAKNIYYCFGCKRGGNILDFVAESEDVSVPEASRLIVRWFGVSAGQVPQEPSQPSPEVISTTADDEDNQNGINKPLTFAGLKNLDPAHQSLQVMGISAETVEHFEAGFCQKGMMNNRVAIPLHDVAGQLIGYAGYDPETETYKHPPNLYPWMELYNLHRQETGSALVVVTDYLNVWRLHVAGVRNVVCLLDGRLSRHQEQLLEVFNPAKLLLLQTTSYPLDSVADRFRHRFYVRHEIAPADVDLTTYPVANLS